ncbi:MAG: hypothetical protein N2V77_00895, partial [Canidatus Methanoxibalbensis ujae]|nr:hypothetical protein [Candidatus Methanoxibalbensis ujae]MCW7078818.1 hypothetical protein [Candidatus Methanoxibalbensis ujae]
ACAGVEESGERLCSLDCNADGIASLNSRTPENVPPEKTAEEGEMGGIGLVNITSSQCRMEAAKL